MENLRGLLLVLVAACACAQKLSKYDKDNVFNNELAKICRPLDRSIDVMFILDGSGSVAGPVFETQMKMVNRVVDLVDVGPNSTHVAILQYSGWPRLEFGFNDHTTKSEVKKAISEITHSSGSTRTGRALDRALLEFGEKNGGRMGRQDVAQVAVVVSDGRSIDDPVTSAERLRSNGVIVMSMGIGYHVFMDELVRIAGSDELSFQNETMDGFMETFKKIAIGEQCDFAKGEKGAEILCKNNSIEVNVMTQLPFIGHMYVGDHYDNPFCRAHADYTGTNQAQRSIQLKIPLETCGVQKQFLFSPRGLMFETSVTLKFHPKYNSVKDKTFEVRCFYPDMHFASDANGDGSELSFSHDQHADGDHKDEMSFAAPEMLMPCAYSLVEDDRANCLLENSRVGKRLMHRWECDKRILGSNYGILVHSCSMINDRGAKHVIIDENGCPVDEHIITAPRYANNLVVTADGTAVKFADSTDVKFKCSIQFCRQKDGECDAMLPPKCGAKPDIVSEENALLATRAKRQITQTDLTNMPSHVMQRLFGRRNFFVAQNGGFKSQSRDAKEKTSKSTEEDSPDVTATNTADHMRELLRQQTGTQDSGALETAPNTDQLPLDNSGMPEFQTLQPVDLEYTPSPFVPRRQFIDLTSTTKAESRRIQNPSATSRASEFVPVQLSAAERAVLAQTFNTDTRAQSVATTRDGTATSPLSSSSTTTTTTTTTTSTQAPTTTTEEDMSMDLQGLAEGILESLNFMSVNIESQSLQVNEYEPISAMANRRQSPVNWCPRK